MLSLALVAVLDNLRAGDCRIVTFGDAQQLEPVGNSWRGKPVDPLIFMSSALLKRWSDHTYFQLTRCRRSDAPHFAFYTSLHENLSTAIVWTRAHYARGTDSDNGLHLCISHRNRRRINALRQLSFATNKACITIPAHDGEPEYALCISTPIVGSSTSKGFVNGAFYEVSAVNADCMNVVDLLTGASIECTAEVLSKHTCLAWAVVYNRAQGCTIRDKQVILHDLSSTFFRRAHLYVGLSRVTNGSDIRVA